MRNAAIIGIAAGLIVSGCGGVNPNAPQTRTVLVDYSHDEFASFFLSYFPREIDVRPGDTIVFKQTWTGEPHTVTMGTKVDELGEAMQPFFKAFEEGGWAALPDEPPPEILALEEELPWMFSEEDTVAQNGAQPCYLDTGVPPKDPNTPCAPEQQEQPPFNGKQSYYNSGFIPYEGPSGNTFTLPLADDMDPGRHFYYCNLHGEFMSGWVNVKPKGSDIPSQGDINRQARREIDEESKLLLEEFRKAAAGRFEPPPEARPWLRENGLTEGRYFSGFFAGLSPPEDATVHGGINEFIPRDITVKPGEKVTWVMMGGHTISFNVPKYFPIIEVSADGVVKRNPRLDPPAGGAPEPPAEEEGPPGEGEGPPGEGEGPPGEGEPMEPVEIDGGTFDGAGFWSSGLIYGDPYLVYHLRFSEPGTYKYACLIHPPMVGAVNVKAA
jgi:plastocyanin